MRLGLPGSERQRAAIARAVLRQPGLFRFDVTTWMIDNATEEVGGVSIDQRPEPLGRSKQQGGAFQRQRHPCFAQASNPCGL